MGVLSACQHQNTEAFESHGEIVCVDCGLVLHERTYATTYQDEQIVAEQEYSYASPDFSSDFFSTDGKPLTSNASAQQKRSAASHQRGIQEMLRIANSFHFRNDVKENAISLLNALRKEHTAWRGLRRRTLRVVCISIACNKHSLGVSDRELCSREDIEINMFGKLKKLVLRSLHERGCYTYSAPDVAKYCERFCAKLSSKLCTQDVQKITRICQKISKYSHLQAKSCEMISAVACIIVCEASKVKIGVDQLCKVTNVQVNTLAKWLANATGSDFYIAKNRVENF